MAKDGYTWADGHPQRRAALVAQFKRDGYLVCWRCGESILSLDDMHVGHDDFDRSITRGPEHARRCNLRAAGLKSQGKLPATPSRNWWR